MDKIKEIKRKLKTLEDKWSELSYAFNKRAERMKSMSQSDREELLIKQEDNLRERISLFEQKAELALELDTLNEEDK